MHLHRIGVICREMAKTDEIIQYIYSTIPTAAINYKHIHSKWIDGEGGKKEWKMNLLSISYSPPLEKK